MNEVRRLAAAYVGLLALLALTVASAFVDLGGFNSAANLAITAAKAALIAVLFMQFPRLAILFALTLAG